MVAQSISGGVRSLMRTLYKPAATEKENDIEIPPAKRRRTEKEYVKRDEGHQNHHSMTKPQNGIAAQRRISSRTRRERNYADHDGNEGEGLGERSNQENEGDDEYPVAGLREGDLEVSRYSKRMRQRNNADHSGNGSESNTGYTIGIVKDFKGYLVASPKKFKDTLRQSSRIRNNGNNADLNGFDEIDMDGKMAKNIEFNKGYSSNYTLEPLASQRPSSRSRPKRNDVDHITNEEDASEGHNDDSNSEYGLHSETNQRKGSKRRTSTDMCHKAMSADSVRNDEEKYNEDLNEGNPAKRLVGRSRRKRNQADHQGNEMEDANLTKLQNGDIRSPTTPTKRLRSRQANDGRLNSAGSGILTSSDKPGITLSSRKILPKSRSEENYRIDTNVFPGQSNPDKAQSSPLSAGRRNQQSHRKDTSLKTPNNSLTHSMNNGRDSPFISENFISGVARKSELLTDATAVSFLRGVLRDRLTCNRSTKLIGIDTEYEKVYRLIEQTVSAGEGNSVLLIGTRGCGKSAIVCKALEEVSREHSQAFYTIRLNGFFLTDDRIALREIWRQLGQEMEVEDETSGKNYADTLSKLLALLSHSTETDNGDSAATQKSLIFIMEEFDQFTSHPRQTLLYNLLDVAQSQKAPIAVIGMTTRIDIAESMEKRVKSRFSHRYIHIPLAKNYDTFKTVCRANLECNSENLSPQELMQFSKYKKSIGKAKKNQKGSHDDFLKKWNSQVSVCYFLCNNYRNVSD